MSIMEKNMPSHYQWPSPPSDWDAARQAEFIADAGDGRVGNRLVSQSDRVRVWHIHLAPGERLGFHTHVQDYFWTVHTAGRARSHTGEGHVLEVTYQPGDTRHLTFAEGEFMIHDLENTGDTDLVFTTVEFLGSANQPLPLKDHDRPPSRR